MFHLGNIRSLRDGFAEWLHGAQKIEFERVTWCSKPWWFRCETITPEIKYLRELCFDVQSVKQARCPATGAWLWLKCSGDISIRRIEESRRLELMFNSNGTRGPLGNVINEWSHRCCCVLIDVATGIRDMRIKCPFGNPLLGFATALYTEIAHIANGPRYFESARRCHRCGKIPLEKRRPPTGTTRVMKERAKRCALSLWTRKPVSHWKMWF